MNGVDAAQLYQELVVDHSRRPRNFRSIERAARRAEGYNPLCGDRITVYLDLADGKVRDAAFLGDGCAISRASASLMTESIRGKSRDEVEKLFNDFHAMATGRGGESSLGKLAAFANLHQFPARVKCAMLAWRTLEAAFERSAAAISTEQE